MPTHILRVFLAASAVACVLAACAPPPTPVAGLPAPSVSTEAVQPASISTEAMPELIGVMTVAPEATPEPTEARPEATEAMPEPAIAQISGAFVKEEVSVTGSYTLDPATGELVFSNDFGVVAGPDLFVVLSGASDLSVDYRAFSDMVVHSAKITLGPLARTNGSQTYHVPEGTDLAQFNTVVIWCESFSVAFAAAPLANER